MRESSLTCDISVLSGATHDGFHHLHWSILDSLIIHLQDSITRKQPWEERSIDPHPTSFFCSSSSSSPPPPLFIPLLAPLPSLTTLFPPPYKPRGLQTMTSCILKKESRGTSAGGKEILVVTSFLLCKDCLLSCHVNGKTYCLPPRKDIF